MQNARIKSVFLGREDHGIATWMITLDYGGSAQGFGGYAIVGLSGLASIFSILDTIGVNSWEDLPGQVCRVEADHDKVHRIGHYLKDLWFDPAEFFANAD